MSSNNNNNDNDNDNDNKKNSADDNDDKNNDVNKKQKLDDNKKVEIDITNLSLQTVSQLKGIASSIGLSIKSGTKKNDIIEMIKSLYKRNQETIAKEVVDSNLNSFNKGVIEFTVRDGVHELEWLFWKIFRNKFIYRRIMSFMDTHLSTPYDSIINVAEMTKSNQLEILRDKIIRNQYLVFGGGYSSELLILIFDSFKINNVENMKLYQQLFKNYGHYSLNFNNVMIDISKGTIENKENGREQLVNTLIKYKCLPALQVLIQDYQYKPTIDNLSNSIKQGSFKFIKLLLQPKFNLNEIIVQSISINDTDDVYSFKSLHYFSKEYPNIFNSLIDKIQSKSIGLDKFKIQVNIDTKLKYLIIFCEIFLKSTLASPNQQNKNMVTIEGIESFSNSLSKQELKLSITDNQFHLVESSSSKKEFIKKLLDLYFKYTGIIYKPMFYHLYFKNDQLYNFDNPVAETYVASILSFRFANSLLYKSINNKEIICLFSNDPHCLFSNCQHEKSKQMEFINTVITSIHSNSSLIGPFHFFYMVIGNDDLDQIKYASNGLGDKITLINSALNGIKYQFKYFITHYIKSKLVLEWLFENYLSHFIDNESIWFFKSVELLQHYQQLYANKFGINTPIKVNRVYNTPEVLLINYQILKHIFKSGPMVYQFVNFTCGFDFTKRCFNNPDYSCQDKLEIYKLDYLNYNGEIIMKSRFDFFVGYNEMYYIKFLDWLYLNHKHGFNKFAQQFSNAIRNYFLFKIGRYNDVLLNSDTFDTLLIFDYKDNFGILDLILNYIKSSHPHTKLLLHRLVNNGRLKSMEYIQQHHSWALKPKSNSNPNGKLSTKDLNSLLTTSFGNSNIKLSEFLFHFFTLSKKDYKHCLYVAQVSVVYFRDKINP